MTQGEPGVREELSEALARFDLFVPCRRERLRRLRQNSYIARAAPGIQKVEDRIRKVILRQGHTESPSASQCH